MVYNGWQPVQGVFTLKTSTGTLHVNTFRIRHPHRHPLDSVLSGADCRGWTQHRRTEKSRNSSNRMLARQSRGQLAYWMRYNCSFIRVLEK
jgi:hypothetical protein